MWTPRQKTIARYLVKGYRTTAIADKLHCKHSTVQGHINQLQLKTSNYIQIHDPSFMVLVRDSEVKAAIIRERARKAKNNRTKESNAARMRWARASKKFAVDIAAVNLVEKRRKALARFDAAMQESRLHWNYKKDITVNPLELRNWLENFIPEDLARYAHYTSFYYRCADRRRTDYGITAESMRYRFLYWNDAFNDRFDALMTAIDWAVFGAVMRNQRILSERSKNAFRAAKKRPSVKGGGKIKLAYKKAK